MPASALAPTFELLILGRVIWGFAAAAPRVVSRTVLRDKFRGDALSRAISMVTAVFLIVPTIAPLIGQAALALGSWRYTFAIGPVFALAVLLWAIRLPETLAPEDRRPLAPRAIWDAVATVLRTPSALGGTIALTALFTAFLPYLSSLERIFDQIYSRTDQFAVFFAASALTSAAVTLFTVRLVRRIGTDRTVTIWLAALIASSVVFVLVSMSNSGVPNFWLFYPVMLTVVLADGALVPLLNSQSLEDVGHIAGTATSIIGAISLFGASVLSAPINGAIDDTVTPFAVGYLMAGLIAAAAAAWVKSRRHAHPNHH